MRDTSNSDELDAQVHHNRLGNSLSHRTVRQFIRQEPLPAPLSGSKLPSIDQMLHALPSRSRLPISSDGAEHPFVKPLTTTLARDVPRIPQHESWHDQVRVYEEGLDVFVRQASHVTGLLRESIYASMVYCIDPRIFDYQGTRSPNPISHLRDISQGTLNPFLNAQPRHQHHFEMDLLMRKPDRHIEGMSMLRGFPPATLDELRGFDAHRLQRKLDEFAPRLASNMFSFLNSAVGSLQLGVLESMNSKACEFCYLTRYLDDSGPHSDEDPIAIHHHRLANVKCLSPREYQDQNLPHPDVECSMDDYDKSMDFWLRSVLQAVPGFFQEVPGLVQVVTGDLTHQRYVFRDSPHIHPLDWHRKCFRRSLDTPLPSRSESTNLLDEMRILQPAFEALIPRLDPALVVGNVVMCGWLPNEVDESHQCRSDELYQRHSRKPRENPLTWICDAIAKRSIRR